MFKGSPQMICVIIFTNTAKILCQFQFEPVGR